ncbi:MAG TPA: hypothetical protein VLB44_18235, partial [Kofleriaceae bacterium]|nr:hypothetical protein [Kofleriaceae bacterium]
MGESMYRVLIGSIMVVALVACGDATNGLPDGPPDAVGTGDGNSCSNRCSADLHQILDCEGNVVETCPDTQGCTPTG